MTAAETPDAIEGAVWHDETERWQRTGRLDQGPCWCPECLPTATTTEEHA